jgi:transposase
MTPKRKRTTAEMRAALTAAMLHSTSIKQAADEVGVSYSNAKRLLSSGEGRAELTAMRKQVSADAMAEATRLGRLARTSLADLLTDETTAPYVRIKAIEVALSYERQAADYNALAERLAALETALDTATAPALHADPAQYPYYDDDPPVN